MKQNFFCVYFRSGGIKINLIIFLWFIFISLHIPIFVYIRKDLFLNCTRLRGIITPCLQYLAGFFAHSFLCYFYDFLFLCSYDVKHFELPFAEICYINKPGWLIDWLIDVTGVSESVYYIGLDCLADWIEILEFYDCTYFLYNPYKFVTKFPGFSCFLCLFGRFNCNES